ncbi:unnamed protein product [Owenia fusiformis]|uniref:Uncharacterized protein n=1 Tax=Owenia fusiformis TaxID=6347 RepID=A0A8J1Y9I7_OWEFU|nr:unnamed protein product [Owenia fusiformis]
MVTRTSHQDLLEPLRLLIACFAEMIGTMMIVLFCCGSLTGEEPMDLIRVSLTFTFTVTTMIAITADVSGGHINPAVTIAMLVARRISVFRCLTYIVFQCVGGIAGAVLLRAIVGEDNANSLGATMVDSKLTYSQGFGIEFIITFILIMTVFAITDPARNDNLGSGPLHVGIAIGMGHLLAVPYTGAGMNPARSLGPAVAMDIWTAHWIYWTGPIGGAILAALLYEHLFAANATLRKTKAWCMSRQYDNDNFEKALSKFDSTKL